MILIGRVALVANDCVGLCMFCGIIRFLRLLIINSVAHTFLKTHSQVLFFAAFNWVLKMKGFFFYEISCLVSHIIIVYEFCYFYLKIVMIYCQFNYISQSLIKFYNLWWSSFSKLLLNTQEIPIRKGLTLVLTCNSWRCLEIESLWDNWW